jgi:hypothetical protein
VNKQRLTKLTRKEIAASKSGGWIDERIRDDEIRRLLESDPKVRYPIDTLLDKIRRVVGHARLFRDVAAVKLEPHQLADQADGTAAVIDELLTRLRHLEPRVEGLASDILYRAEKDSVLWIRERIAPDLTTLMVVMRAVAVRLATPARPGPRRTYWTQARDDIAAALQAHAEPKPSNKAAADLAADILSTCDLPNPRKARNSPRKSS